MWGFWGKAGWKWEVQYFQWMSIWPNSNHSSSWWSRSGLLYVVITVYETRWTHMLLSGFYLIFDFTYFPTVHRGSRAKFAWCNHDCEKGFEEFNCGCWGRCYRRMCLKFVGRYHLIILVNIFKFKMFSLLDGDKPVPEAACTNYSWEVSAFH